METTMVNASLISRLSHAVDLIEERIQQNRPWKVVTVRRGLHEDADAARDRHFAAHPEDRDANCLEAEVLTDVQQRLVLLSRDMENHNGQRIPHQPAFSRS
jgi:hypothetical protein